MRHSPRGRISASGISATMVPTPPVAGLLKSSLLTDTPPAIHAPQVDERIATNRGFSRSALNRSISGMSESASEMWRCDDSKTGAADSSSTRLAVAQPVVDTIQAPKTTISSIKMRPLTIIFLQTAMSQLPPPSPPFYRDAPRAYNGNPFRCHLSLNRRPALRAGAGFVAG